LEKLFFPKVERKLNQFVFYVETSLINKNNYIQATCCIGNVIEK
jgi:hypothetical protein